MRIGLTVSKEFRVRLGRCAEVEGVPESVLVERVMTEYLERAEVLALDDDAFLERINRFLARIEPGQG